MLPFNWCTTHTSFVRSCVHVFASCWYVKLPLRTRFIREWSLGQSKTRMMMAKLLWIRGWKGDEARIRLPVLFETIVTVGRKEPISNDRSLASCDTRRSCKESQSQRRYKLDLPADKVHFISPSRGFHGAAAGKWTELQSHGGFRIAQLPLYYDRNCTFPVSSFRSAYVCYSCQQLTL